MDKVIQDWNLDWIDLFARSLVSLGNWSNTKLKTKKQKSKWSIYFRKQKQKHFNIFGIENNTLRLTIFSQLV